MEKQSWTSRVDTKTFEPFLVEGKQLGEIHFLRQGGVGGTNLLAGIWKCGAMTFPYDFPFGDETVHCVEGGVVIALASGEKVEMKPGDIASFLKGTKSTWTVASSVRKFFVICG